MSEKKTKWKHQTIHEAKAKWEEGGGVVNAIDEPNCEVSQMYARLLANGQLASTVAHSASGSGVNANTAYAMIEDMSIKCVQYQELGENHRITQSVLKKLQLKQSEMQKLKQLNESIENYKKSEVKKSEVKNETT